MPAKKSNRRRTLSKDARSMSAASQEMEMEAEQPKEESRKRQISPVLLAIPFILALLVLVLWKNKGWIVAATVNNQPVWRWDLEQRFVARYGTQTLDEMVNEQILKSEAAKQGLSVSAKDVDQKISEIEKTLQGRITLKDALAQQGMTMDDFRRQVELQVLVEKLTASKVKVSDKEIADFIEKNKESMTATDAAAMNEEAKNALLQEKRASEFQKFFADLKKKAKVTKYL